MGSANLADCHSVPDLVVHEMPSHAFDWPDWHLLPHEDAAWLAQIRFNGRPLEDFVAEIHQGLNTGADDVFLMREVGRTFKRIVFAESRVDGKTYRLEADMIRPIVRGRHIRGYRSLPSRSNLCVFPFDRSGCLLAGRRITRRQFPFVYQYLTQYRPSLSRFPAKHGVPWYDSIVGQGCGRFSPRLALDLSAARSPLIRGFTLIDDSTICVPQQCCGFCAGCLRRSIRSPPPGRA